MSPKSWPPPSTQRWVKRPSEQPTHSAGARRRPIASPIQSARHGHPGPHSHDQTRKRQALPVRPRHQCADARSDRALPLPGTRHLPADGGAGGAGPRQEGHVRGRAQRPSGQPLPRPAHVRRGQGRDRRRPAARARPPSTAAASSLPGHRPALFPDRTARPQAADLPARHRPGQQHPRHRPGAARAAHRPPGDHRLQGHQPAHQGRRARHPGRGLFQRPGPRRRLPALHRPGDPAGRLLGASRQGSLDSWKEEGRTLYRVKGPDIADWYPAQCLCLGEDGAFDAMVREKPHRHRGHRRTGRRLSSARATTSGASTHATASRISRSTC